MRIHTVLATLALACLGGCNHSAVGDRNYAASPGSTCDAARNPAQAHDVVTYDANSPILPHDFGNGGAGAATR